MRRQGFSASKWARSRALSASIFSFIAGLHGGSAIAGPALQVTAATVISGNVTTIPSQPPGTCANYNSAVSTGVPDTNQTHHQGLCRWAEFQMLVEGVPLAQYLGELSSGQRMAPPFTVTQSFSRSHGLLCSATGL
jgi:hypothetical protein